MADHYSQAVVQPSIPGWLVDKADRLALEGLGYTFEEDGCNWYLFAAEGENSAAHGINPRDWLETFDECHPEGVGRPGWVVMLATHLRAAIDQDPNLRTMIASDWDLDFTAVPLSGTDVFQGMLQKPINTGALAVREITIEGAWTCGKMRPDGFGGWVESITAKGIRYDSTHEILERWANEAEQGPKATLLKAAEAVLATWDDGLERWLYEEEDEEDILEAAKAVVANWEHGDLAAAVRRLTEAVQDAQTK